MQAGSVSGGVASRFGRLPKPEELVEELAQVYYAGLLAQLAQRFASGVAATATEEGKGEEEMALGESPICQLALRLLLSVAFDRVLHSSKAVGPIQVRLFAIPYLCWRVLIRPIEHTWPHAQTFHYTHTHTHTTTFRPSSTSGPATSTSSTRPPHPPRRRALPPPPPPSRRPSRHTSAPPSFTRS